MITYYDYIICMIKTAIDNMVCGTKIEYDPWKCEAQNVYWFLHQHAALSGW